MTEKVNSESRVFKKYFYVQYVQSVERVIP